MLVVRSHAGLRRDGDRADMGRVGTGQVAGGGCRINHGQRLHSAATSCLTRNRSLEQSSLSQLVEAGGLREWHQ